MTRGGRLVRVLGYYIDASLIERVVSSFRKLLIDVDWICGGRLNAEGLFELYLLVRDHPNLHVALLNLSKTVGVECVEIFNPGGFEMLPAAGGTQGGNSLKECPHPLTVYVPTRKPARRYCWGEVSGEDL